MNSLTIKIVITVLGVFLSILPALTWRPAAPAPATWAAPFAAGSPNESQISVAKCPGNNPDSQ